MTSIETSDYRAFLESKAVAAAQRGMEDVPALAPHLFAHQVHCVEFGLRVGSWGCFLDTGLGKTACELEFLRHASEHSNGRALILTPLAVARQIETEGKRWGYDIRVIREQDDVKLGINVCNYDRLEKLTPDAFGAVALDECFAAGTTIDTPDGRMAIENICVGREIWNASGRDVVIATRKRSVDVAVRITIGSSQFICSENHPWFTSEGWRRAIHIEPGTAVMATAEAVRMVRSDVHRQVRPNGQDAFLRALLLCEMADVTTGTSRESSHARGGEEARSGEKALVGFGIAESVSGERAHQATQSVAASGSAREDQSKVAGDWARSEGSGRQRSWPDETAGALVGSSRRGLGAGACDLTRPEDAGLSDVLQSRRCESDDADRDRSGRLYAWQQEGVGRQEGRETRFARVDRVEVLKQGHSELERFRNASGSLYFYDIEAARHPSFSVSGLLVHNSSILKSFTGKTTHALIEAFGGLRWRMAATATPAPNDHVELAQHSEFLGLMARDEMLVRWFINDGGDSKSWRLKRHGVNSFFDWMSSWSRMAEHPRDLGFDEEGFDLPKLNIVRHRADAVLVPEKGTLFAQANMSATSVHDVKRQTAKARSEIAAALVTSNNQPWLLWCDTDYEADALLSLLGDRKDVVEVRGSHSIDAKEQRIASFLDGSKRVLITKSSICGFGLNLQFCSHMVFVGRSFSYESWYQAVRRCWRFGQANPVTVHIIVADGEDAIGRVLDRKSNDHSAMKSAMAAAMKRSIGRSAAVRVPYNPTHDGRLPEWLTTRGDTN